MTLRVSQLRGFGRRVAAAAPSYNPGIYAYWLDPTDLSSMKQDRTGASATVASAVNSPVGSFFNKGTSGGWLTCPSDAARPILRQNGALFYLEWDGVNNYFNLPASVSITTNMTIIRGAHRLASNDQIGLANTAAFPYEGYWSSDNRIYIGLGTTADRFDTFLHVVGSYVITSIRTSALEIARKNGNIVLSNPAQTVAGALILLGRTITFSSSGYMYGLIFNPTELTGTALSDAEAYMATKSGATIAFDPALNSVWLDPSDLSSMKQDRTGASATIAAVVDSPVGSWFNKGTIGTWLTAPSDGQRPILRSGSGLFWLEFDGVDDVLFFTTTPFQAGATAMISSAITRASAGIKSAATGNTAAPGRSYGYDWWTDNVIYYSLGSSVERTGPTSTSTGNFVMSITHSAGNTQLRRNAVQLDTFADANSAQPTVNIGRHGTTDWHTGNIYGIIAANSISNLAAIETYLGTKCGLTL